jgi:hypothetical protein
MEKIPVIMMLPPLNMYYTDSGIKFMEKKLIVELMKSQNAGIAKYRILILSVAPLASDSTRSASYSVLKCTLYHMKTR